MRQIFLRQVGVEYSTLTYVREEDELIKADLGPPIIVIDQEDGQSLRIYHVGDEHRLVVNGVVVAHIKDVMWSRLTDKLKKGEA